MGYTSFHSNYWAHRLTLKGATGEIDSISRSISNSKVDLNPHQIDAALFALRSPLSKGAILADEVGLGKTIEAGIVLAQKWAERKRSIILILPAFLRKQWQQELESKFFLPTYIIDSKIYKKELDLGNRNPFSQKNKIVICSYNFASRCNMQIAAIPWDLAVIDEAHRMRNVYKKKNKMAKNINSALGGCPKLLLTATPLQNSLMELYGLVSVIDEHVFGDALSFRQQFVQNNNEQMRNILLRERINPICNRTLRKQVVEYVPFTKRVLITQDFIPSAQETRLYDLISEYLQRDSLIALPASQRALITLVLRKLLASSTFAITNTLKTLINRLENLSASMELLTDDDLDGIDEYTDELDDDSCYIVPNIEEIDAKELANELAELRGYLALSESITFNAKGDALKTVLNIAFDKVQELGASRKAVIFTESRRTQEYLYELLSQNGFDGKLAMINGSNTDPFSRNIYKNWLKKHKGQETITGSRAIDMKASIVEFFKDEAEVLIATEAAAEGINLQFCSLIVNYDLPWNPQRVEQRIGRCHRYGQKHDVVVANFINKSNAADIRVHELLKEKFQLFDGVFGASDEILGALESGVDFERRIAEVFQSCRTTEEIEDAFDQLQKDLDEQIQARLAETRKTLLENMDEEVAHKLRVFQDKTLESLNERQRWLLNLTLFELDGLAKFSDDEPRFNYLGNDAHRGYYHLDWKKAEENGDVFFRQDHALAKKLIDCSIERELLPQEVVFNYSAYGQKISALEPYQGKWGTLSLHKLSISSFENDEFLIFACKTDDGEILDQDLCNKIMTLPADVGRDVPYIEALPDILNGEINKKVQIIDIRNGEFFEEEVLKLDRWSDDLKKGLENEIKELDAMLREEKKRSKLSAALTEKLEAQKNIKAIEADRSKKRKELFNQQDAIDVQRDILIAKTEKQLKQEKHSKEIFKIRWCLQ